MKPASLLDDIKTIGAHIGSSESVYALFERAFFAPAPDATTLVEVGIAAELGVFRTLALLLKGEWEVYENNRAAQDHERQEIARRARAFYGQDQTMQFGLPNDSVFEPWQPWNDPARLGAMLAPFTNCPSPESLEVLILEQQALGCHQLGTLELVPLERRYHHATALLDAATPSAQREFLEAKGEWLRQELQLAQLTDMRKRVADEMEQARMAFLLIVQDVYLAMLDAANRLALWRYRQHFGDITMTEEEVRERLVLELAESSGQPSAVPLEPELLEALRDCIEQLRSDLASIHQLARLSHAGHLALASAEDLQRATTLFRKLARKIHPDALRQHPQYDAISSENKKTLEDIWVEASATHRNRVYLEQKKLINYVEHLEAWCRRAEQILRHLDFHDPGKIIEGETLDAQLDCIGAALVEVGRYLHAVRDEISMLQLDPQHQEHLRVIGMSEQERQAERCRIAQQASAWNYTADQIQSEMEVRSAAEARAEASLLKGARS